jgi:hypothetical protein
MTFGLAPPKNVSHPFGNWLKGIPKNDLIQIRLGVYAVIWLFGTAEMTMSLTNQKNTPFCRLFLWLPIRSICGPISNKRNSRRRWILGATSWRR